MGCFKWCIAVGSGSLCMPVRIRKHSFLSLTQSSSGPSPPNVQLLGTKQFSLCDKCTFPYDELEEVPPEEFKRSSCHV